MMSHRYSRAAPLKQAGSRSLSDVQACDDYDFRPPVVDLPLIYGGGDALHRFRRHVSDAATTSSANRAARKAEYRRHGRRAFHATTNGEAPSTAGKTVRIG